MQMQNTNTEEKGDETAEVEMYEVKKGCKLLLIYIISE
jgi:hypothetical protein